jgi:hypothetical protein
VPIRRFRKPRSQRLGLWSGPCDNEVDAGKVIVGSKEDLETFAMLMAANEGNLRRRSLQLGTLRRELNTVEAHFGLR